MVQHREQLFEIYNEALNAVNGRQRVADYFYKNQIDRNLYLVALGKAATSMTLGAIDALGDLIQRGLIISSDGDATIEDQRIVHCNGDHPLPGHNSIAAGKALLQFIGSMPADANVLVLLSGGASAMVEVLPDVLTLEQLTAVNQWLLQSGIPISGINAVRKRISSIKGGKLAHWLGQRQSHCIIMSDVQNDDPTVIGSGLLFADRNQDAFTFPADMPGQLRALCDQAQQQTAQYQVSVEPASWHVIANNGTALLAAREYAQQLGYTCHLHENYLTGEAERCGIELAQYIVANPGVLHIWGGETTVSLPDRAGLGGRCQVLALSAARTLAKASSACLLACGTDGRDGPTPFAGAMVDHTTLSRLQAKLDIDDCLARADAGNCLQQCGDTLPVQHTGSNVADIVLGYSAHDSSL